MIHTLYSSVGYNEDQMREIGRQLTNDIDRVCKHNTCSCKDHVISSQDVRNALGKVKKGKHEGEQNLFTDHLIHGSDTLDEQLASLFSLMLTHSYIPESFKRSIIIPIPKDKRKSLHNSENYRGITLSSVLCKVFDHILIDKNQETFCSSDLQFGFKKKSSTTQCTFVLKETIEYYVSRSSSVYATLLDASKAFDRVNYVRLFKLLMKKGCCPLTAKFLANLYTCQTVRVRWLNAMSRDVNVKNGIKQGGVLSPILFSIYTDELLQRLKRSGYGCYIGTTFLGALAYADDIVIISPTRYGLRKLLQICDGFSDEYQVLFNASKSHFLYFGTERDVEMFLQWRGNRLVAEESARHLGHIIGPNVDQMITDQAIVEMYTKTNVLASTFGHCNFEVKYRLFKTYIMGLYGCVLWNLSPRYLDRISTAWRKCIRKLFRIPYRTHSALLPGICDDIRPEFQIYSRVLKFITTAIESENDLVKLCARTAINGSRSSMGTAITNICAAVNVNKFSIPKNIRNIEAFRKPLQDPHAAAVRELLYLRDHNDYEVLERGDLNIFIDFLCTG